LITWLTSCSTNVRALLVREGVAAVGFAASLFVAAADLEPPPLDLRDPADPPDDDDFDAVMTCLLLSAGRSTSVPKRSS
jgi:hypothetical protein